MNMHLVKIKSIDRITHDVLQIVTDKPSGFTFVPGQATEVSINKNAIKDEKRPFSFTSLPGDDYLEFTIKTYPSHQGVTVKLLELQPGDGLILHDVFGAIAYKGEGVFIAGGAGVTPFISILRQLKAKNETGKNKLIFANKTKKDIILEEEFRKLLGDNFINILSDEKSDQYAHGLISEEFLKKHMGNAPGHVYVCGPPPMMKIVLSQLSNLGIEKNAITTEEL